MDLIFRRDLEMEMDMLDFSLSTGFIYVAPTWHWWA